MSQGVSGGNTTVKNAKININAQGGCSIMCNMNVFGNSGSTGYASATWVGYPGVIQSTEDVVGTGSNGSGTSGKVSIEWYEE